jgi:hypothetical protein
MGHEVLLANPPVPKLGLAYAIVEGTGTWSIQRSNRGCSVWKEVRQQYPPIF